MKESLFDLGETLSFSVKIFGAVLTMIFTTLLQTNNAGVIGISNFDWHFFMYGLLGQASVSIFYYRRFLYNHKEFSERYADKNIGVRIAIVEGLSGGLAAFLLTKFIFNIIAFIKIGDISLATYLDVYFVSVAIGVFSEWYLQFRQKAYNKLNSKIDEKLNEKENDTN